MSLFSQDEDEEAPERAAVFFSGGPVDPDAESETPSLVEMNTEQERPEPVLVDDAAAYGQPVDSPENQDSMLSVREPDYSFPMSGGVDGDTGAAQYAVAEQPEPSADDPYKPIAAPATVSLSPFADHSADYAAMTAQKAREATQNVKPSIGRRILAGLAGGAVTFGGGDGGAVTEKVLNRPAQRAQQQWTRDEAPIQARIAAGQAQDAATQRSNTAAEQQGRIGEQHYRNQIIGQQDAARAQNFAAQAAARRNAITAFTPDDPNNPYAGGTGTTADGRTIKGVPPPDKWIANWEKQPQNVANAQAQKGVATLAALEKSGVKLTPEQRAIVASGGKVTPAVRTTISIRENPDGTPITPKSQSMTQAQKDVILQAKQRDMTAAQNSILPDKDKLTQMQSVQDTFEQKVGVDPNGPEHMTVNPDFTWSKGGQKVASPAAPAQQQPAAQPSPTAQPNAVSITPPKATTPAPKGATGRVKGSDGNWYWIAGNKVIGRS